MGKSEERLFMEPTKDEVIKALQTALVSMEAIMSQQRELIEMLIAERELYCATAPREEVK